MIPNPFPGKFIVFEGPDGCGKSTQLKKTENWIYDELNQAVIATKEPDKNGDWGSLIYEELKKPEGLHKTDSFGFQTWYACDSKKNLRDVIIPRLRSHCVVLSDRFRPSLCYGAKDPSEIPALMEMNEKIIGEDFIWPDAILIFDVMPELGILRLKQSNKRLDEHEKTGVQRRVRNNYIQFGLKYKNCFIINGELPPNEVFALVKDTLASIVGQARSVQS